MPQQQTQSPFDTQWQTFAGTIRRGMDVIGDDGRSLGTVERVEGDLVVLSGSSTDGEVDALPLSLIDGVSGNRILLAPRGDATFGLGAEP